MSACELTIERLQAMLRYDPASGTFIRLIGYGINASRGVGDRADWLMPNGRAAGYCYVRVGGRRYAAHRLAWFYVHGSWPAHQIDHIDGDPGNNRIDNLRDVPASVNQQNRHRAAGVSGFLGVSPKNGKWMAVIRVHGKQKHIGLFKTPEEAGKAYLAAKRIHHPTAALAAA